MTAVISSPLPAALAAITSSWEAWYGVHCFSNDAFTWPCSNHHALEAISHTFTLYVNYDSQHSSRANRSLNPLDAAKQTHFTRLCLHPSNETPRENIEPILTRKHARPHDFGNLRRSKRIPNPIRGDNQERRTLYQK